jgi:hypothetical protein
MKDLALVLADLRREVVASFQKRSKSRDDLESDIKRAQQMLQLASLAGPEPRTRRGSDKWWKNGRRKWLEKWDNVDRLLPELVSLAGIQPEAYKGFCLAVHERVQEIHDNRIDRSLICDAAMREAERRLRSAQDAIATLSHEQRVRIGLGLREGEMTRYTEWTGHIPKVLEVIAKFTESGPYRPNVANKRGPKRARSHWVFRELVRDLWRIAQAHGGDFTLWADDRGGARGSIVDALDLLKQVFPPGFVPPDIPRTTLNRFRPRPELLKIKN